MLVISVCGCSALSSTIGPFLRFIASRYVVWGLYVCAVVFVVVLVGAEVSAEDECLGLDLAYLAADLLRGVVVTHPVTA